MEVLLSKTMDSTRVPATDSKNCLLLGFNENGRCVPDSRISVNILLSLLCVLPDAAARAVGLSLIL